MQTTAQSIIQSLKSIAHPYLGSDLVSLDMIRNLEVHDGVVRFRLVLSTPACPEKARIESSIKAAVMNIPGVRQVDIEIGAEVKKANRALSHQGGQRKAGVSAIEGVAHVIAVSSGKGGVGKSTVAVNLACALAQHGARVGLMDADVYGPNIPTMMGVTEKPKLITDEVRGERFVPPSAHGVRVMSMGFLVDPDQPLVWRGPMLHSVMNQFCHQVEWGDLDYLVVDMPPGTGDVQLSLAQMVPVTGAVLVTTPQEVAVQDVRKAYAMFEKVRIPMLGVVENMSYFQPLADGPVYKIFGEGGGKRLSQKFGTELLTQLPIEMAIREGGDLGTPVTMKDPESPIAKAYRALAQRVAQKISMMAAEGVDPNELIQIGTFN